METIAKKEIETHIELLTTPMELVYISGMIEMAYELKAITEAERADYLNKSHAALVESVKRRK